MYHAPCTLLHYTKYDPCFVDNQTSSSLENRHSLVFVYLTIVLPKKAVLYFQMYDAHGQRARVLLALASYTSCLIIDESKVARSLTLGILTSLRLGSETGANWTSVLVTLEAMGTLQGTLDTLGAP